MPRTPQAVIDEAREYVRIYGSINEAARQTGIPRSTLQGRLSAIPEPGPVPRDRPRFTPIASDLDGEIYRHTETTYQPPRPKHEVRAGFPHISDPTSGGEPITVLCIPDRHNDPRFPHRLACSKWIAQEGSARRPDWVVCLSDEGTYDSVSRHVKRGTHESKGIPTIKDDLDNFEEMERAFESGRAPDWKPKKVRTMGNHPGRLYAWENENPESYGTHTARYEQINKAFGWNLRPHKEVYYIGGVGFTHAPVNGLGKLMGGKTAAHRAGALLCSSLVHGHTHVLSTYNDPKLDPRGAIMVYSPGCALPWGEYEDYTDGSPRGWWWGIAFLTICNGIITDKDEVSMKTLQERYG